MLDLKERSAFKEIAKKYGLSLIILFGSKARDPISEKSDLDIAVWFDSGNPGEEVEEAILNVFINLLKRERIDLVILKLANPLLQFEVASKGRVLYEKEEGEFNRFQVFAMKRNDDGKKFYSLNKVYLENFLRGRRSYVKRRCHPPKVSCHS